MSEFDSESIWKELQKEEESLRSKYKSININKKRNNAFWRKQQSTKPTKHKDRWNHNNSFKNQNINNKDEIMRKNPISSIKHAINLLKDNESSTNKKNKLSPN